MLKALIFCCVSPEEYSHIPLRRFADLSNRESNLLDNDCFHLSVLSMNFTVFTTPYTAVSVCMDITKTK